MKKLLANLGIKKMDEMEKDIAIKSQRIALIYVTVALFVMSIRESYKVYAYGSELNLFPCFLLMTTAWVMIISQSILRRRAVSDDKEFKNEFSAYKIILTTIIVASIILAIGTFVIMSGIF